MQPAGAPEDVGADLRVRPPFFWRKSALILVLGVLFAGALALRLYRIDEPPMDQAVDRQYWCAINARALYYDATPSVPEWRREIARLNGSRQGALEPSVVEHFAAWLYRIAGGEHLWIPRTLSVLLWTAGGVFIFLIARRIADVDAAVFSTGFYLYCPYGVLASRGFQPDPLMIFMMVAALYAILRHHERPSAGRLVAAAALSGVACIVKPMCGLQIAGAFLALALVRDGLRALIRPQSVLFAAIAFVPPLAYYLHVFLSGKVLHDVATGVLSPGLLLKPFFWPSWLAQIAHVIGYALFATALVGTFLFRGGPRALLLGLWGGYLAYGMVFCAPVSIVPYYQLPLIPVVALAAGPAVALVARRIRATSRRWEASAAVALMLFLVIFVGLASYLQERRKLAASMTSLSGWVVTSYYTRVNPDFESRVRVAEEVGRVTGHSRRLLFLAPDYGHPLLYHGEVCGRGWPSIYDLRGVRLRGGTFDAEKELHAAVASGQYDYFVVTDLVDYDAQPDLKRALTGRFRTVAAKDDYMIFDLRPPAERDGEPGGAGEAR
jgi:hypothetical protein